MSSIRDEIYLAALLHDIGKFYQRADKEFYNKNELSEQSKRIAQMICPVTREGYFSHKHVIWTNEFFERYKSLFSKYVGEYKGQDNLANLASYHHRPATILQALIQLADWWASGLDRSRMGKFDTLDVKTGKQRYKEIPLSSILGALKVKENAKIQEEEVGKKPLTFGLNPLSFDRDTIMPREFETHSQEKYHKLWELFAKKLDQKNFNTSALKDFNITMFYILKQYTWSIPSFTQDDFLCISLFEHLKITAAIAQCLYDYYTENPGHFIFDDKKKRLSLTEGAYPIQLVCFDLSGIQNFLYNISSTHALKSLRGRSFYLQMLIESLAWYLIKEIPEGFTPSHIVYSSGGKFFMLLPNTEKVNKLLNELSVKIQGELWEQHRGELYLNIGKKAFRYENDIRLGKPNIRIEGYEKEVYLGSLWESLFEEVKRNGARRFIDLIDAGNMFEELFEPSGAGGNTHICGITGTEYQVSELFALSEDDEGTNWVKADELDDLSDKVLISKPVKDQIELGRKLVDHKFIVFKTGKKNAGSQFYGLPDFYYDVVGESKDNYSNSLIIQNLDDPDVFPGIVKGDNQAYAFRYFGGSTVASKNGKALTFTDIAKGDKESSFSKLGVLRMDVDNLGKLFTDGFKEWDEESESEVSRNASFSAYANFSGLLDLFFTGYINTIRESEKYRDTINIIYSGGDDLFAVGRWDRIIDFAEEVRNEFRCFTGRNDITISAGIEFLSAKFPISKAAENAGRAEAKAKNHIDFSGKSKNSLCLLGITANWDSEWPVVTDIKNKIKMWFQKGYITKGLIMFLLRLYVKWKHTVDYEGKEDMAWKWLAAYSIARRQANKKDSPEEREALEELKRILFTQIGDKRIRFDLFALALRLVEFETRNIK